MKLYVLIDSGLAAAYQSVQAGHCVAEWLLRHPNQEWNNNILVYLACPNLTHWINKLDRNCQDYTTFYEPDIDQITAVACYSNGNAFKNLRLMGA